MGEVEGINLRQFCHVNTNLEGDTFVGIKSDEDGISICFPIGYRLPDEDNQLRTDIIKLIEILSKYGNYQGNCITDNRIQNSKTINFPIQAYMYIIIDYMQNNYYTENEVRYKKSCRGKINWTRTIKNNKFLLQDSYPVYLEYIVKDSVSNDKELISLIHEYCVYESFQKLGWLYTTSMPRQPRLRRFDKQLFSSIIYNKLGQTFNDNHRELFNSMLAMINYLGEKDSPQRLYFGTERFEYVWEKLIDFTFGVSNKNIYFPKTKWSLRGGRNKESAALEPDSIMINGNKVYVLDAKYYKYGVTANLAHLPESTSINKQITYGEYIATNKEKFGDVTVYNAFLMPFDRTDSKRFVSSSSVINIGEATGDWKTDDKEYERVQGILIDVRFLMHNIIRKNKSEIMRLSEEIDKAFRINE